MASILWALKSRVWLSRTDGDREDRKYVGESVASPRNQDNKMIIHAFTAKRAPPPGPPPPPTPPPPGAQAQGAGWRKPLGAGKWLCSTGQADSLCKHADCY